MKSKELREKRAVLAEQAGDIIKLAAKEERDLTSEEQEKFDKIHVDIDSMKADIDRLERQEDIEKELAESKHLRDERNIPGREDTALPENAPDEAEERQKAHDKAFRNFLLGGVRNLSQEDRQFVQGETRAQSVGTTTAGGFLVPTGFRAELEKALLQFGGMRQSRATVLRTATGNDLPMPTSNDTGNSGALLAENTTDAEQDVTFGSTTLNAYKYTSKIVKVSIELMQDSAFSMDAFLAAALGERLGRIHNTHFTTGTGSGQPNGVVTAATLGKTGTTGQTTSIIYDDLVDLEHSVDPAYRGQAEWMLNDSSVKIIKKLVDGNGLPLWSSGIAVREPDTILGYPWIVNQDMAAMAANAKSVLFGDFSKYMIRDVMDITMIRLAERYADAGQVGFIAFSRNDGDLLDAGTNPVKYYANSAT